jgi:outer membrane protein assembly factor BamB
LQDGLGFEGFPLAAVPPERSVAAEGLETGFLAEFADYGMVRANLGALQVRASDGHCGAITQDHFVAGGKHQFVGWERLAANGAMGFAGINIAGNTSVTSYDPNDGSRIWFADGPSDQAVASTVYSELAGLLFATGGYPQRFLLAIKPDGSGNVSQTHVTWRNSEGVAYVPSPILVGEYLLTVTPNAVMYCLEAATGKVLWKEKVIKHHASPVSVNGLVYFIDDKGQINVIKPGPTLERVAQHELGEATYASPALSEGQVFVRGEKSLFCIGKAAK